MKRYLCLLLVTVLLLCACSGRNEMIGEEKAIEIALQEPHVLDSGYPVSKEIAVCEIVTIHDEPYYEVTFKVTDPDTEEHWSIAVDIDAYTGEVHEVMTCC